MFRFKDSNFYLNQVCVPHCVCEVDLYDGMLVDVDMGEPTHVDKNLTNGKYVVIGESLNRPVVVPNADGYSILHDVHPAGSYVRVFELAKLNGVEFISDQLAAPAVVGEHYRVNEAGKLAHGDGEFLCVESGVGYATFMLVEVSHDE